jgi:glycosyltransferase involved in cell wall biosynthesis
MKTGYSVIIDNDINGILVIDQNENTMSEKLKILINLPEIRIELANNAIYSLYRFNIDSVYKKYLNIFENI